MRSPIKSKLPLNSLMGSCTHMNQLFLCKAPSLCCIELDLACNYWLFQQQKLCKYRPISCKRTWSICSRVLGRSVTADGFRACSALYADIYNNGVQGDMSCICKKTREAWKHIWIHPINKCSLFKHDVAGHVWWDTEYTRRLLHLEDESLSMERNFQSVNWVAHFLSWEVKKRQYYWHFHFHLSKNRYELITQE